MINGRDGSICGSWALEGKIGAAFHWGPCNVLVMSDEYWLLSKDIGGRRFEEGDETEVGRVLSVVVASERWFVCAGIAARVT